MATILEDATDKIKIHFEKFRLEPAQIDLRPRKQHVFDLFFAQFHLHLLLPAYPSPSRIPSNIG
jgi:hypothetical protein